MIVSLCLHLFALSLHESFKIRFYVIVYITQDKIDVHIINIELVYTCIYILLGTNRKSGTTVFFYCTSLTPKLVTNIPVRTRLDQIFLATSKSFEVTWPRSVAYSKMIIYSVDNYLLAPRESNDPTTHL